MYVTRIAMLTFDVFKWTVNLEEKGNIWIYFD